jgi:6-phosphogluconolactonase
VAQALLHPYAQPFDLTVLGVGEDGHIASLFPGAAELGAALAADAPGDVFAVNPPATAPPPKVPRLTLGLRRLLWSRQLVLLCAGVAKRRVVEAAMHTQDLARCPVGALFQPGVPPLQLIYLE